MAYNKDSMKNIIGVALSVCLACAIVVSVAAIALKPQVISNKRQDRNKNILIAAGLFQEGKTSPSKIQDIFKQFEMKVVDLKEKRILTDAEAKQVGIDPATYNQRAAAKDPKMSKELSKAEDIASISRRARYSVVYILKNDDGSINKVVLPIHGYGLWSTMYGFLALKGDFDTVAGITFYEQQETAGLGGEVENPAWKALWDGKKIYNSDHKVVLNVIKGNVDPKSPDAIHQVDGLSGATMTSRGVQHLIHYWLGEHGFGPVLATLKRDKGAV